MSLESDLKKVIGNIWFARGRLEAISKHEVVSERARLVKKILSAFARYDSGENEFSERLVLDNYYGSLQRFLVGDDLASIHLSSKAMEVALLMSIRTPSQEEKKRRKGRLKTFEALRSIAIDRRLIKTQEGVDASRRVIDRRNMAVHDAILKQAIEIEQSRWLKRMLSRLPAKSRKLFAQIIFLRLRDRVKQWESLPDFSWYVTRRSHHVTRELLEDFFGILDQKIKEFRKLPEKSLISTMKRLPTIIQDVKKSILRGEASFMKHCARENLEDVKVVLDDIYENKLLLG